jgi:hypothetical protein
MKDLESSTTDGISKGTTEHKNSIFAIHIMLRGTTSMSLNPSNTIQANCNIQSLNVTATIQCPPNNW